MNFVGGLSKSWFRKQPLKLKKNTKNFIELVKKSMGRQSVLEVGQVRKCTRRMRSYMIAYMCVDNIPEEEDVNYTNNQHTLHNHIMHQTQTRIKATHRKIHSSDATNLTYRQTILKKLMQILCCRVSNHQNLVTWWKGSSTRYVSGTRPTEMYWTKKSVFFLMYLRKKTLSSTVRSKQS